MSRRGNCYDNAAMESWFSTLKFELGERYETRAEAKEKLFLPHFSTKARGTGLGLAIVHRIVADHHGTIRVEDNRPRGTTFTIELPAR